MGIVTVMIATFGKVEIIQTIIPVPPNLVLARLQHFALTCKYTGITQSSPSSLHSAIDTRYSDMPQNVQAIDIVRVEKKSRFLLQAICWHILE